MSKKYIIIVSVLLVLVLIGGAYYWQVKRQKSEAEQALKEVNTGVASEVSDGTLPALDGGAINPMDGAQSANPYEEANPFSKVKTNPFE
ncbi:MAG: hypothetical protein WCW65_03245 [Candidatus Paceibacterota bacterium]